MVSAYCGLHLSESWIYASLKVDGKCRLNCIHFDESQVNTSRENTHILTHIRGNEIRSI